MSTSAEILAQASTELAGAPEPQVSVVLPVFEEEETIGALVAEIVSELSQSGLTYEIVAVDDGSQDGTAAALQQLRTQHPDSVRIARHVTNRGNGAALRTGIRVARGAVVVTMDADGQHAPEHIPTLLEHIPPNDLVIGARTERYQGTWHRNLANWIFRFIAGWLTRKPIDDLTSGFRAMRRQAVDHFLPLFPEGFSAPTTTTMAFLKAGYNVAFVPIRVRERSAGKSKIQPWSDGTRFLTIILRMVMLYDPLRIFLPVGALLTVLGIAAWIAGVLAADRLVIPNSTVFLFSAALLTWLLGLVSDQISSTRIQYHGDETVLIDGESEPTGDG